MDGINALDEFVAERRRVHCDVCELPHDHLGMVNAGRRKHGIPLIVRFLIDKLGHKNMSVHKLRRHFDEKHHER